jgi:diphosphomevalonate decarboxylase
MRERGTLAWATIDAGPHVVALCIPADAAEVADRLRAIEGVRDAIVCAPAGAARVVA